MRIMVAVDLGNEAEAVLERAIPWGARLSASLHLRAVSQMLWEPDEVFGGTETQALAQEWERRRSREASRLGELGAQIPEPLRGEHDILQGSAAAALLAAARDFDVVIVGTHGRQGLERLFLGSVAERVVREAPVPVVVVPLASEPILASGPLRAVCPVDAASPDLTALKRLHAWMGGAVELHVVYALADLRLSQEIGMDLQADSPDTHPHRVWADRQLRAALEAASLDAQVHFVLSMGNNPAADLALYMDAQQADVVAMPTRGRTGLSRVAFGSVAERLVRFAHVPTLVVR